MSEYIKLDDVKAKIREEWVKYMPTEMDMSVAFVLGKLSDLPIIEVSEDCISRANLIQDLRKDAERVEMEEFANDTVWRTIGNAPSVIPQPKEGEWISNHNGYWTCSECGLSFLFYAKGNYCPNCGSKMKGANDVER